MKSSTCKHACPLQQSDFKQTSPGWKDKPSVGQICFPHSTEAVLQWVEGCSWCRCYWYAPHCAEIWLISHHHSNDCLLWLIRTFCGPPVVARSMQMSHRHLKEQSASNQENLGELQWVQKDIILNVKLISTHKVVNLQLIFNTETNVPYIHTHIYIIINAYITALCL